MIRVIYPQDTATLYEASSSTNTSLDETVRLSKYVSGSGDDPNSDKINLARTLVRFNNSEMLNMSSSAGSHKPSASKVYKLKMFVAEEANVRNAYTVEVAPVSTSFGTWISGTGRKTNIPRVKDGVCWANPDGGDTTWAHFDATTIDTAGFRNDNYIFTQSYNNIQGDIDLDVTTGVVQQLTDIGVDGTNGGFVVSFSSSLELDNKNYGDVVYFSKNTQTIYSPKLELHYDDTPTYTVDGMTHITSGSQAQDIKVNARLQSEYKRGSIVRIHLDPEPQFIARSQTGAVSTGAAYALPDNTLYTIIDETTNEQFIQYNSTSTKVAVSQSNYFDIDTTGLYPERYYRVQIQVPDLLYTGSVSYFDIPTIFKVVR